MNGVDRPLFSEENMIEDQDSSDKPSILSENSGLWMLIGAVILATAGAIYMVPDDAVEAGAQQEQIEPIARVPATSTTEEVENDPTDTPGSRARNIIKALNSGGNIAQAAYDAAVKQRDAGRLTDAYLLYFFAARNGHAEAALELGSQADPAHFNSETSNLDGPDIVQAYKWYHQAMKAGNGEAESRLARLHDHVILQASRGDAGAERLLLQWK